MSLLRLGVVSATLLMALTGCKTESEHEGQDSAVLAAGSGAGAANAGAYMRFVVGFKRPDEPDSDYAKAMDTLVSGETVNAPNFSVLGFMPSDSAPPPIRLVPDFVALYGFSAENNYRAARSDRQFLAADWDDFEVGKSLNLVPDPLNLAQPLAARHAYFEGRVNLAQTQGTAAAVIVWSHQMAWDQADAALRTYLRDAGKIMRSTRPDLSVVNLGKGYATLLMRYQRGADAPSAEDLTALAQPAPSGMQLKRALRTDASGAPAASGLPGDGGVLQRP